MPVEVAYILRRAELAGDVSRDNAALAHQDLLSLRCELFNYELLATLDHAVSRASGPDCRFFLPPVHRISET